MTLTCGERRLRRVKIWLRLNVLVLPWLATLYAVRTNENPPNLPGTLSTLASWSAVGSIAVLAQVVAVVLGSGVWLALLVWCREEDESLPVLPATTGPHGVGYRDVDLPGVGFRILYPSRPGFRILMGAGGAPSPYLQYADDQIPALKRAIGVPRWP